MIATSCTCLPPPKPAFGTSTTSGLAPGANRLVAALAGAADRAGGGDEPADAATVGREAAAVAAAAREVAGGDGLAVAARVDGPARPLLGADAAGRQRGGSKEQRQCRRADRGFA